MSLEDDQLTGYAKALKKVGKYPLAPRQLWKDRKSDKEHPVATAFLVIPSSPGDPGTNRPLDAIAARHSAAIEILDANNLSLSVTTPLIGKTYVIRCQVINHGAAGCYAGIAEFYITWPKYLGMMANGDLRFRPAPLGYASFMLPPGGQITVTCQKHWTVRRREPRNILVRVYDPIVDKPESYNSATDRHVARRDAIQFYQPLPLGSSR